MNDNDMPGDSMIEVTTILEVAITELIVELVNSKKLGRRRAADVVARVLHTARNMHPDSDGSFVAQQLASSVGMRLGLQPEISVAKLEVIERGEPQRRPPRTLDEAIARQPARRVRQKTPGNPPDADQ